MKKLPYGISNYEELVEDGYYYVDKTRYIEKLENLPEKRIIFLRPRKFGKTLFTSILDNYYDINYNNMNFAIIMGAEHAGVSKSLLKLSDFTVKIPMLKDFNSLNVSNALSAIIFETVRQKLTKK